MQSSKSDLSVKRLELGNEEQKKTWDAYVFSSPKASFFHRAGWQDVIAKVYKHNTFFLYAVRDEKIEAILPLVHIKSRLFGNFLTSSAFAVYGGIVSSNEEAAVALENEAKSWAKKLDVDFLEFRNTEVQKTDWPNQDLYVTFRKEIHADEEANMLEIPRKQRAMVRKGIKNELVGEIDSDVDRFFALYASNVLRHGTPAMPKKYFKSLKEQFADDCEILTVVDKSGRAVSSVMSFYFKDEVLPYYAGDDEAARDLAANDFKYWELMRRACARGIKVFDYGRSKKGTGSYAFKKNWGFSPAQLSYEYQLYKIPGIPQNNPNNKKYKLMISVWRKLPLPVANFIGPFIVKSLG